jgi:cystathionine beta-lyase/cystathionine gamma-synthase
MRIETITAQAAYKIDAATGAVTPPIHLSTTFERDPDGEFSQGFIYSRSNNPNRQAKLERNRQHHFYHRKKARRLGTIGDGL